MTRPTSLLTALATCLCAAPSAILAHTVLTYPLWRGNTLITNEGFPRGMQWTYPCGGLAPTQNRSYWPLGGGAVALQPGWFTGHSSALLYVNLGVGADPLNYSMPLVPVFRITGPPGDRPYPGTICLPEVRLPGGYAPQEGDLASIQVIELAVHGAGAYNCADIIFTSDMSKVAPVSTDNCFNSSNIQVDAVRIVKEADAASCTGLPPTTTTASGTGPGRTGLFTPTPTAPNGAVARSWSRLSAAVGFFLVV